MCALVFFSPLTFPLYVSHAPPFLPLPQSCIEERVSSRSADHEIHTLSHHHGNKEGCVAEVLQLEALGVPLLYVRWILSNKTRLMVLINCANQNRTTVKLAKHLIHVALWWNIDCKNSYICRNLKRSATSFVR